MMQECPKCGFSQPEDRFCANCGLDIENYKPKPVPAWKKIASSSWFQLSLVMTIIGAMVVFIYIQQTKDIAQLTPPDPTQPGQAQTNLPAKETGQGENQITQKAESAKNLNPTATTQSLRPQNIGTAANSQKTSAELIKENQPQEAPKAPTELIVEFVELPLDALQKIIESGQNAGGDGPTVATTFKVTKTLSSWIQENKAQVLPGKKSFSLSNIERPFSLRFGPSETESESESTGGFSVFAFVSSKTLGFMDLDIEVRTFLPPPADLAHSTSFSSRIPNQHALIVSGVLPLISGDTEPPEFVNQTPLEVYFSGDFVGQLSDFAIIIYPKSN